MVRLIVIRHCKAMGQEREATLTLEGYEQAQQLVNFLERFPIQRVISSPFTRAIETITPYVNKQGLQLEIDERLQERILSTENMDDWMEKLQQTFVNYDLKFDGGESSNEATNRVYEVINEIGVEETVAIVTHGNLMSLLLHKITPTFGFQAWAQLSNPDVYSLENKNGQFHIERIWK